MDSSYPAEVGQRLKQSREAAALTQRELAEKLGKTSTTVSRWERGAGTAHPSDLRKAAAELHVDWRWLLSGTDGAQGQDGDLLADLRDQIHVVREAVEANRDAVRRLGDEVHAVSEDVTRLGEQTDHRMAEFEGRLERLTAVR